MASRIRHRTEPVFGWLFVAGVIAVVAVTIFAATKPRPAVEVTGRYQIHQND